MQTILFTSVLLLVEAKDETKNRGKRQFHPRRGARPPPYAVQMEPIVQYSQRDPLYNSLAIAKSDEGFYDIPQSYYPSEPEPIIEIIIKESNETLPTPVPPPQPPAPRPTKEPIQVFYVKYEKKKNHGDGKSQVVYDAPIPALTPVEEHEKIEEPIPHQETVLEPITPAPSEPSTTLRAIIRPDSESYHAPGSSGLRVTFGTDQVPPNNHHKRSDQEPPVQPLNVPPTPLPTSSKKSHGPYQPLQPIPHRVQPAFPQQRIVNSIPPQQLLQNQQLISNQQTNQRLSQNFPPQQFQNRNSQRLPITIQGLPEFQQKTPFNVPHRINNNNHHHQHHHSQQSSFSGPLAPHNFNPDHQQNYKQQEEQKQKYYEQRRHQELLKQREQQRLAEQQRILDQQRILEQQRQQEQQKIDQQRQQEQQKYLEHQRLQEQRRKQEQDQKLLQDYRQQIKYNQQFQTPSQTSGEILKAVPKLEQHFAIRENPLHPGPFPPNPQIQDYQDNNRQNQHLNQNSGSQQNHNFQQHHQLYQSSQNLNHKPPQQQNQHFDQNSQKRISPSLNQSIWGRPTVQNSNQKIYATPASQTEAPKSLPPVVTTTERTTTTTTTTTTLSPKNEAKIKENIANLPDEVPDDIREQLLSSGILGNADIQILDYDKIGGIPIENLPPEALENFYSAGGAAATSASEPIPSIAKRPKTVEEYQQSKLIKTEIEQATLKPGGVEMKVVRFDPNTAQGQTIAGQHIRQDATHLNPVIVGTKDDPQYNRYLPLKVSGASFPIPDVPELKGKKISSVVVLAPVDYNFKDSSDSSDLRKGKKLNDVQAIKFLAGESLKQLVKKPTSENYKKWLEQEQKTPPQRQSVVLLVTT